MPWLWSSTTRRCGEARKIARSTSVSSRTTAGRPSASTPVGWCSTPGRACTLRSASADVASRSRSSRSVPPRSGVSPSRSTGCYGMVFWTCPTMDLGIVLGGAAENAPGVYRIDTTGRGHDDRVISLALVAQHLASQGSGTLRLQLPEGRFLSAPIKRRGHITRGEPAVALVRTGERRPLIAWSNSGTRRSTQTTGRPAQRSFRTHRSQGRDVPMSHIRSPR